MFVFILITLLIFNFNNAIFLFLDFLFHSLVIAKVFKNIRGGDIKYKNMRGEETKTETKTILLNQKSMFSVNFISVFPTIFHSYLVYFLCLSRYNTQVNKLLKIFLIYIFFLLLMNVMMLLSNCCWWLLSCRHDDIAKAIKKYKKYEIIKLKLITIFFPIPWKWTEWEKKKLVDDKKHMDKTYILFAYGLFYFAFVFALFKWSYASNLMMIFFSSA